MLDKVKISSGLILLLVITCCHTKQINPVKDNQPDQTGNGSANKIKDPTFSPIDSLNKHLLKDTVLNRYYRHFYAGQLNNAAYGFIQTTKACFSVFKKENNQWRTVDTYPYDIEYVQPTDLNGDNFTDVIITYLVTGAGGNSQNICLLYDSLTHKFRHNRYFDLPNISYDKEKELLHSSWYQSVNHPQQKMSYRVIADSVVLKDSIIFIPDPIHEKVPCMLKLYRKKGNKTKLLKEFQGTCDHLLTIFTTTIWNSENE